MIDTVDPTYLIASVGAAYSLAYRLVQKKFGNMKRVKEIQKQFSDLNKELSEATKKNDQAKVQEIMKRQQEVMPLLNESMIIQFKPMIFVLPLIFLIPMVLRDHYNWFSIKIPFAIPVFFQHFENFPNWRDTFGPVGWFFITIFLFQIAASLLMTIYNKLKTNLGR